MLAYLTVEAGPELDGVRVDVEAGLDERHRRVLQVEFVPSRERVVNAVDTERLRHTVSTGPGSVGSEIAVRTSNEDSGWKLSMTRSGLISRTWRVVCFKLPMKGAAEAVVAHTTARKTERKNVPESFMVECRFRDAMRETETGTRERGNRLGFSLR